MKTLNKVQLIGYLGKDPVIHELANGNLRATMRLATNHWTPQRENSPKKSTQWHTVIVWNNDVIRKFKDYLIKGSHIMVEGSIVYRTYTDTAGIERNVTEIHSSAITDLDR